MMPFLFRLFFSFLPLLVSASPSSAIVYHERQTDHFIIQYHDGDAKLSLTVAEQSEKIRTRIVTDVGYDLPGKTRIILAPSLEEFRNVQPGQEKIPSWAAAVAYPEENLIIIRSPGAVREGRLDYPRVFVHEFTHIVLGRALQNRETPAFLIEGIAMYESSEWHLSRMAVLTKAALTDRLIPLQKLTDRFPDDPGEAELAYAESFMFISYLIGEFGRPSFQQFIKDYAAHGNLRLSLLKMTGRHIITLEDEWMSYMKLRVSWIPLITSATTLWFIASCVFIYGYFRKRKKAKAVLLRWDEEEKEESSRQGP